MVERRNRCSVIVNSSPNPLFTRRRARKRSHWTGLHSVPGLALTWAPLLSNVPKTDP